MRIRLKKTITETYHRIIGYQSISINGVKCKCDPYHMKFWDIVNKDKWEPQTFKILDKYLDKTSIYCDIGAWIGPTVLFAANKCKQVYCFEPDIIAYRYLLWNIALNNLKNVLPNNIALSHKNGIESISSMGTELGDSMTSLLGNKDNESINILCTQWELWEKIVFPEEINLIKIDIEGAEFEFIPTFKNYLIKHKPVVYMSLHAPFLNEEIRAENLQKIVDTMSIYNHCYNEEFVEVDINELTSKDNQINFNAYIFKD